MRKREFLRSPQRAFVFERQELWDKLPGEHRDRCRNLCVQLLLAVIQAEEDERDRRERQIQD